MDNMVFIVGTGRCGSTFVHEVLARHEAMGFVSNIEDNLPLINTLGRWNNALYRSPLGSFTRKGSLRFAPSEAYRLISKEVSPIYADPCRDLVASDVTPWLERRFRDFFERRAIAQAKPVFSQKYTGWPRIGFFARIFPEARFINVVRDGRAVANSWLQMPWWGGYRGPENWLWGPLTAEQQEEWRASGYSFPRLAALSWKILMTAFHHAESELGEDRYLKIRYEDILEDPEQQFERMLRFCSLTSTAGFRSALSRQQIRRDRARAFERDLTRAQLSEVEESLGHLLEQYRYL
jgi:hypothetical protein